jgi:O-antigen/teichoic acid export membrane protein
MIVFLFSGKYAAAGPCLVVLVPAVFFAAQMQLASRLLGAAHRPGVRLIFTCCILAVAVACHVVLIHFFGIQGAAFASLATFATGAVAGTVLIHRYLGALPPMWTALRCAAAGMLVYAVGWFWPAPGWLVLVKLTGLSLLYLGALFVLRELRWKDVLAALRRVGM